MHRIVVSLVIAIASCADVHATCWHEAAHRYGVDARLLYAIAATESALRADAVNGRHAQRTGTYDIGLMQINSGHLHQLAQFGIREADLFDPCINLHVGAWILSRQFAQHGVSWDAVGAYNAACTRLQGDDCQRTRAAYAWRVYRHLPPHAADGPRPGHAAPARLLTVRVTP